MEKEQKIDLPKPVHIEKIQSKLDFFSQSNPIRVWSGYDIIDVIFYLYLFNKYKNNCLIKYKGVTSKTALGVELQIKLRMSKTDKEIYKEHLKNVAKQLVDCIKRDPVSIIIPLYLKTAKGGHANVLIYRRNGHVIEHFEPHGKKYTSGDNIINDIVDKKLNEFIYTLNAILTKEKAVPVTLVRATDVCPANLGIQTIETKADKKKLKLEGEGYCAAWSMFFTELALKNPSLSSNELLNIVYDKLNQMDKDDVEQKKSSDYMRKVIIGYVNLIYQKIEKYFSFVLGEKVTVDNIIKMIKTRTHGDFMTDFNTLVDVEMELLNNPSLTKEEYVSLLQSKMSNTTDIQEINNIQRQIDMLDRLYLLLSPSLPSNRQTSNDKSSDFTNTPLWIIEAIKDKSDSSLKISSSKSVAKKNRKTKKKTTELEEVIVDDKIVEPMSPEYAALSSEKISQKKGVTPIKLESLSSVSSFLITPNCPEGKVFDSKKGRCVKIRKTRKKETTPVKSVSSVIKKSSPKTKTKAKTKKLKPCPEGEERNPETGRCKKIKIYAPCPEGQIRDPITHRCRKPK